MAEKDLIVKEKVEHSGLMDFAGFYSFVHSWFKEEGYGVDEVKYAEKSDGTKRDIDIEWKITKRLSDYFKFEHKLKMEIKGLAEVEVETDGKKKKTNQGKITVEISGSLIRDPDSKWDKNPSYRFMRDLYNKYVIPSRVDNMMFKVSDDVKKVKEEMKAFFELSGRR
jgi:hypothetical protein